MTLTDHDSMWAEASRDTAAEADARVFAQARVAASAFWPWLAGAGSVEEYAQRLALADDRISAVVQTVAGRLDLDLKSRLTASLAEDYAALAQERAAAKIAAGLDNLGDKKAEPFGKGDDDEEDSSRAASKVAAADRCSYYGCEKPLKGNLPNGSGYCAEHQPEAERASGAKGQDKARDDAGKFASKTATDDTKMCTRSQGDDDQDDEAKTAALRREALRQGLAKNLLRREALTKTAGDTVEVNAKPKCDVCRHLEGKDAEADYDARLPGLGGSWGNVCERHFKQYGPGRTGTGDAQRYVVKGSAKTAGEISTCAHCGKPIEDDDGIWYHVDSMQMRCDGPDDEPGIGWGDLARQAEPVTASKTAGWASLGSRLPFVEADNAAPYRIEQDGGTWRVVNDKGETKGTHDSREEALAQQRALYANVPGAREKAEAEHKESAWSGDEGGVYTGGPCPECGGTVKKTADPSTNPLTGVARYKCDDCGQTYRGPASTANPERTRVAAGDPYPGEKECPNCHGACSVPAGGWESEEDVDNGYVQCPTCGGKGSVTKNVRDREAARRQAASKTADLLDMSRYNGHQATLTYTTDLGVQTDHGTVEVVGSNVVLHKGSGVAVTIPAYNVLEANATGYGDEQAWGEGPGREPGLVDYAFSGATPAGAFATRTHAVDESAQGTDRYHRTRHPQQADWVHDEWDEGAADQATLDEGRAGAPGSNPEVGHHEDLRRRMEDTLAERGPVIHGRRVQANPYDPANNPYTTSGPGSPSTEFADGQSQDDKGDAEYEDSEAVTTRPRVVPSGGGDDYMPGEMTDAVRPPADNAIPMAPSTPTPGAPAPSRAAASRQRWTQPPPVPEETQRRVIAKIAEVANGLLATNPGMEETTARYLAAEAIHRYPGMVRGLGGGSD